MVSTANAHEFGPIVLTTERSFPNIAEIVGISYPAMEIERPCTAMNGEWFSEVECIDGVRFPDQEQSLYGRYSPVQLAAES
jgi:hypothetical protein